MLKMFLKVEHPIFQPHMATTQGPPAYVMSELRGLDSESNSPAPSFKGQGDELSIRSKPRKRARRRRSHSNPQKVESVEGSADPVVGDNATFGQAARDLGSSPHAFEYTD